MEEKSYKIPIHNTNKVVYRDLQEFFRLFFLLLKPYHNLSTNEMIIAAELYRKKYELSKVILDGELLDAIVLNPENKRDIRKACGNINTNQFNVTLVKFKKVGLINNGRINPKFMPLIKEEGSRFNMVFSFVHSDTEENPLLETAANKRTRRPKRKNEQKAQTINTESLPEN